MTRTADIVVVGGGLVGCAVGRALARNDLTVAVLEAESAVARHQSGRNSGVVHSGLYYAPGSLRARLCVVGRDALYRYAEENAVPCERTGKLVVATEEAELARLGELERRGRENGLEGLERLDPAGIRELEPQAAGIAGLFVPQTGIVDFAAVNRAYADEIEELGGEVLLDTRFLGIDEREGDLLVRTSRGELAAGRLINCAGLQADRVARACGVVTELRIVPFRGEYYRLAPRRAGIVSRPVYPVPDPAFPFLGVHLTPRVDGSIEAGPNAVLALAREGYSWTDVRLQDARSALGFAGFWRFAARHWRTGLAELRRSFSRHAFARSLQRLVPAIGAADLEPGGAGVRAQMMAPDGRLIDDFRILSHGRTLHVLNTPSPAATASLAIGSHVAGAALEELG